MRPPLRAVGDDDVDRPQVRAWRHVEPSGTNGPRASALLCAAAVVSAFTPSREGRPRDEWRQCAGAHLFPFRTEKLSPAAAMILRESVGKQPAAHPQRKPSQRELGGFPVFRERPILTGLPSRSTGFGFLFHSRKFSAGLVGPFPFFAYFRSLKKGTRPLSGCRTPLASSQLSSIILKCQIC